MGLIEGRLFDFWPCLLLQPMFVRPCSMNQVFMSWGLLTNAAVPKNRKVRGDASGRPRSRCQSSDESIKFFPFCYIFIFSEKMWQIHINDLSALPGSPW